NHRLPTANHRVISIGTCTAVLPNCVHSTARFIPEASETFSIMPMEHLVTGACTGSIKFSGGRTRKLPNGSFLQEAAPVVERRSMTNEVKPLMRPIISQRFTNSKTLQRRGNITVSVGKVPNRPP